MKKLILVFLALTITPAFVAAEDDESTGSKLLKAKILQESDDDSSVKKLIKMDAAGDILEDEDASGTEKLIKMKMMDEATKEK